MHKIIKNKTFIPFAPPLIGNEEKREVMDTLGSGWITTGPKTQRFEEAIKRYVNAKHAVCVNSCTAALHLSLDALGIKKGDEVITSPFTFASTGHVILHQSARPIFVDVDKSTFNMDPDLIKKKITKKTKAIIPVHYGGHPCQMHEILKIARKYNLKVVEDAAHAIGSKYKGRMIGSIGDVTCFSFYATKNMTTAEGGILTTNDKKLADKARILSMYGISDARRIWKRYAPKGNWYYDIRYLGYKYNMTDIQASLGLHQLKRLPGFIKKRSQFAKLYDKHLRGIEEIQLPRINSNVISSWHLYPILLKDNLLKIDRNSFIEKLKGFNIGTSVLFQPLHLHSFYRKTLGTKKGDFPVSEDIYNKIVCLPVSPKLSFSDINYIALVIKSIIRKHKR